MPPESNTKIDISKVPFSKYGSNLAVCHDIKNKCLTIHNARRMFGEDHLFTIIFGTPEKPLDFTVNATPESIRLIFSSGSGLIYLRNDDSLFINTKGIEFQLQVAMGKVTWGYENEIYPTRYGTKIGDRTYKMIRVDARLYSTIDVNKGIATLEGPMEKSPGDNERDCKTNLQVIPENNEISLHLEISPTETLERPGLPDIGQETLQTKNEWEKFLKKMPMVPDDRKEIAELSWYNLWSSVMRAEDTYRYDAMLMSKKFMCSVWTWDHCFNALAVAGADLKMGLNQFFLPFELQSESGALPDYLKPHSETVWSVTKPPIHGWCFQILMDQFELSEDVLKKAYVGLARWTDWWMYYRDSDNDGIPDYPQGCDSGWDNSTLFDIGYFLESPDLSAFLVLQMRTLANIADRLGNENAKKDWNTRTQKLLEKLYEHSWIGDKFVAKLSHSHEYVDKPTSLLAIMPLVLGDILDKAKFDKLIEILTNDFLTDNGPATEAISSKYYESDSYWRGPIWAPSTYLLVDGLRRGGREDLAVKIARDFCNMIRDKAGGNFENFDAITGEGLRAPGYTWTASVHLLLLEYL